LTYICFLMKQILPLLLVVFSQLLALDGFSQTESQVLFAQESNEADWVAATDSKSYSKAEICDLARRDAKLYHGKELTHAILGLLTLGTAAVGTIVSRPNPERGKFTSRGSDHPHLFTDEQYCKCYRRAARGKLIAMEGMGAGLWIVLIMVI
jgi:hypothetical protein